MCRMSTSNAAELSDGRGHAARAKEAPKCRLSVKIVPLAGHSKVSEQFVANCKVLKEPLSNISMATQDPVQAQTARDTEHAHVNLVGVESGALGILSEVKVVAENWASYSGASTTSERGVAATATHSVSGINAMKNEWNRPRQP